MPLSRELLEMLSCPKCEGKLIEKDDILKCSICKKTFPIEDGVPNLLSE